MKKIISLTLSMTLLLGLMTGVSAVSRKLAKRLKNLAPNAATIKVKKDPERTFSDKRKGTTIVFDLFNAQEGQELGDANTEYREQNNSSAGVQINLPAAIEEGQALIVTPVNGEASEEVDTAETKSFTITKITFDSDNQVVRIVAVRRKGDIDPEAKKANKVASKLTMLLNRDDDDGSGSNDDDDSSDGPGSGSGSEEDGVSADGEVIENIGVGTADFVNLGGQANQSVSTEAIMTTQSFQTAYDFDDNVPVGTVVAKVRFISKSSGDFACGDSISITDIDGNDVIDFKKNDDGTITAIIVVTSSDNPSSEESCEVTVEVVFQGTHRITNNTETVEDNVNAGDNASNNVFFGNEGGGGDV